MNARKISFITIAILVIAGMAFGLARNAFAVHDLGLFELDRDAAASVSPGDDWSTLYGGGGSAQAFTGILADIGADGGDSIPWRWFKG